MRNRLSLLALAGIAGLTFLAAAFVIGQNDPAPGGCHAGGIPRSKAWDAATAIPRMKMGPGGPEADSSRTLSGHHSVPGHAPVPELPKGPRRGSFPRQPSIVGRSLGASASRPTSLRTGNGPPRPRPLSTRSARAGSWPRPPAPAAHAFPGDARTGTPTRPISRSQTIPKIANRVPDPVPPKGAPAR